MLFKPSNYNQWIMSAVEKIQSTIDSCTSIYHFDVSRTMVDNFIMMLLLNDKYDEEDIRDVSRQLFLYLEIKKSQLI